MLLLPPFLRSKYSLQNRAIGIVLSFLHGSSWSFCLTLRCKSLACTTALTGVLWQYLALLRYSLHLHDLVCRALGCVFDSRCNNCQSAIVSLLLFSLSVSMLYIALQVTHTHMHVYPQKKKGHKHQDFLAAFTAVSCSPSELLHAGHLCVYLTWKIFP